MENVRKYFKRDISWLSFNYRVLMEAMDHTVPLFDRIKIFCLSISPTKKNFIE